MESISLIDLGLDYLYPSGVECPAPRKPPAPPLSARILPIQVPEMNQMTRQEMLDVLLPLNEPQNRARCLQWLTNLGYQMTIAARGGYPTVENKIQHLVAFNELQHQLYNQIVHFQTSDEWYKVEVLLENLRKYAVAAGVAGDFGWAARASIRSLIQ